MADHLRDELGKMLDQYDQRRRTVEAHERKVKADDERFLSGFAELRRAVVRPVFEAAGEVLKERGHGFSIVEQEFATGTGGQPTEAGITFIVIPAGTTPPMHDDHARALSITTRHYNKSVWINSGEAKDAGGRAGAKGAHELDKIDRQLIEEELLRFVAAVVAA